jgi:chemotaxis protein methyltransferase CheR
MPAPSASNTPAPLAATGGSLSADNYRFLQQYIQRESGIALGDDKLYLIQARLMPVLAQEKLASLDELCARLQRAPQESLRRRVIESMTTHETLFFRDPQVFDTLRTHLIPELAARRRSTKSLRIWSAACSSGQETYSLAMLLVEHGISDWNIEIVGTDLSNQILERARAARYLQLEMNRGLPAALLVKHFERAGLDWQVKQNLRRMARFQTFDLRDKMDALGYFDLVLCRNVLIYFDLETRRRILTGIRGQMYAGGYLILGSSETTFNLDTILERKTLGGTTVYQKPAAGGSPGGSE